jgi:hypothetical protein
VKNLRCRLTAYAYIARFEWMLDAIERDRYCLRAEYPERKSLRTGVQIIWATLASMLTSLRMGNNSGESPSQSVRVDQ